MKIAVPGGYMLGTAHGSVTIELCSGFGPQQIGTAMPDMDHHAAKHGGHDKSVTPCGFAALAAPSLAAADPVLLAAAIIFVLTALFLTAMPPVIGTRPYIRPPLRGPPASA